MIRRLRRWHFDVLFFLGLALWLACWWFHPTRPRWTSPIILNSRCTIRWLGFSTDQRWYYTVKDTNIVGSHLPEPFIQKWNVANGQLVEEYPLQVPARDRDRMKTVPAGHEQLCFTAIPYPRTNYLYTRQYCNTARTPDIVRVYDITSGACVNEHDSLERICDLWPLQMETSEGHPLGGVVATSNVDEPLQIVDMVTNKTIHSMSAVKSMRMSYVLLMGSKVFVVWTTAGLDRKTVPPVMRIYQATTWECLCEVTLPLMPLGIMQISQPTNRVDLMELKYFLSVGANAEVCHLTLRWNEAARTCLQEGEPLKKPYHSNPSGAHRYYPGDQVVVEQVLHQREKPWQEPWLTINHYMSKVGLTLLRPSHELECKVSEIDSGRLVRRLSGIPYPQNTVWTTDREVRLLIGLQPSVGHHWMTQYTLVCYDIPPWWFDSGIRWARYGAWGLVLLWPLRYLIRPRRGRSSPPLTACAVL